MLDKNYIVKVSNRDNGSVGYSIPEMHIVRNFQKGESKEITMGELRQLSYIPGGQVILNECLIVHDQQALAELNPNYEPEYFYTEEDVKKLLLTGSQDQFLDCLDFAPDGVINLIKDLAVKLEINDLAKREAIFKKTGFNVTKAIEINHESEVAVQEENKARRATPINAETVKPESPVRRSAETLEVKTPAAPVSSRYNIVQK